MESERLQALKAKLASRDGKSGYEANAKAIKDEIARLEAEQK